MGDRTRGFHNKFSVSRKDCQDLVYSDKHFGCEYFVLDLTHDPHAKAAILAYAESVRKDGYELLANDLVEKVSVKPAS